jgi:hypothetical protein
MPFHPYYESPQRRDREAWFDEINQFLNEPEKPKENRRILPVLHPFNQEVNR